MNSSDYYLGVLKGIKTQIETLDGTIVKIVASLTDLGIEGVASSVGNISVPETPVDVTVTELDKEWWLNNKDLLLANGWEFDGKYTFSYHSDSGDFTYNIDNHRLKTPHGDNGSCTMLMYGDPSQITEVFTALKSDLQTDFPNNSNTPRLLMVEDHGSTEMQAMGDKRRSNHVFETSEFGDILLGSLGNKQDLTHTIGGFSAGGLAALREVSEHPGYYDKLVLFNISPGNAQYSLRMYEQDPSPLKGLNVEIVCNFKNEINSRTGNNKDCNKDYYTTNTKGPHLDKLVAAGANVTLIVPDTSIKENCSSNELAAYARNLGIPVKEFLMEGKLEKLPTYGNTHGVGGSHLMYAYMEGLVFK